MRSLVAVLAVALGVVSALLWRYGPAVRRCRREDLRRRYAAIAFDSTSEAIFVTDEKGDILAVNRAFESVTGFQADEVLGRNPRFQKSGRHEPSFYSAIWSCLERSGQWQGEIWNCRKSGEIYPAWQNISMVRDPAGRTRHYVAVLADISAIKDSEERLRHMAHHDSLTGLANRLLFSSALDKSLQRAARESRRCAVLFIDVDRFKLINDTMGHDAGDTVLRTVADRIKSGLRAEDTPARMAGDEFVVLLDPAGTNDDVERVARKLIDAIGQPMELNGKNLAPSVSVGIALYPDDADTAQALVKAADTALYQAKQAGRRTFAFYLPELTLRATARIAQENRLRRALERGEWVLHYQPRFDLATGRTMGVEALLRWQHPEEGLLLPASFLEVAESSGLIEPIGNWVIGEACRQAAAWVAQGLRPGRIAINVSTRQILYDHVVDTVRGALRDNGLDDADAQHVQVELEVAETALQSVERCTDVLQRLHDLGVTLAVDDFGSGHASLRVLQHLPLQTLKIGREFVRGLPADGESHNFAKAIVSMAHSLGLRVVAEGVETPEQLGCVRTLGCDEVQGYLTGRAMPVQDVDALLARNDASWPVRRLAAG
jgi:diguanylate cyclase (GGDEF)-like protein/PAS domain S-box-containing protein